MAIRPIQLGIKVLFEQNHTFQVPKYQRGYAWDDQAVNDFLSDLKRCLNARMGGGQVNHFFGGIVAAKSDIADSNRSNYEVIDGQQRLATFVLLIACLVQRMKAAIETFEGMEELSEEEDKANKFLAQTLSQIEVLYLSYQDAVGMTYVTVDKLTLSEADHAYFLALIGDEEREAERASHERLETAWELINTFLDEIVFAGDDAVAGAERVSQLVGPVLEFDCSVIFMATDTRSEAYQIFQVLNDRGVHLTDGDLLRARTLELMDSDALRALQNKTAEWWDEALSYPPKSIDDSLRWYFSSFEGKRPSTSGLADQFMTERFKVADGTNLTAANAKAVRGEVKAIAQAFADLETMGDGDWPFASATGVKPWDQERLRMLVTHLRHTNAMPLLLSLETLGAKKFAQGVAMLERFVFRYKTIGGAHVSPMADVYLKHAKLIRTSANYNLSTLRTDLRALLDNQVPEALFRANLEELRYRPRAGNGHIRYMLIAIEDHIAWLKGHAAGAPKCSDKSIVIDFTNTTLEHVYPRSAKGDDKKAGLERYKETLGNLTIFGPEDNDKLANKGFTEKKPALVGSKLQLNRDIGANDKWRVSEIKARSRALIDMAVKLFVP